MSVDLAARWLGGSVVAASNESFGLKEQLLIEAAADFIPGRYDHRGEIVDGWETRRRRAGQFGSHGDFDWVVVRLGAAGVIDEIDVDTSFFTGNYPTDVRVEALAAEGYPSAAALVADDAPWHKIVGWTAIKGDTHNRLSVADGHRYTHVRLCARPDGGIARLRVRGEVLPDPTGWLGPAELSGIECGGRLIWCSDEFYSMAERLLRPDRPATMGEGWETARRRGAGHDSVVVGLGMPGVISLLEVDTTHFKYNASDSFQLWGSTDPVSGQLHPETVTWRPLTERTALVPDQRHRFLLAEAEPIRMIRFDAHPDGGVARLRAFATPIPAARTAAEDRCTATRPARVLKGS